MDQPPDDRQVTPEDSARELAAALADPELAEQVREILTHLGSAPFDPVGTPTD